MNIKEIIYCKDAYFNSIKFITIFFHIFRLEPLQSWKSDKKCKQSYSWVLIAYSTGYRSTTADDKVDSIHHGWRPL